MAATRLVLAPLLALVLLAPAATALVNLPPTAAPGDVLSSAAGVEAAAAADADVAKADELLAEAHEKAKIAARRAHAAEAAKARLDRLHEKIAAKAAAETGAAAASPTAFQARLIAYLEGARENAILESDAARADAFDLASAAKDRLERRLAHAQGLAHADLRAHMEARLARAQSRAEATAAAEPEQAVQAARAAVADAMARVEKARGMDDEAALAEAERLLAFLQKKLDQLEERAERWGARAESDIGATIDRPTDAPFDRAANARAAVTGAVTSRTR